MMNQLKSTKCLFQHQNICHIKCSDTLRFPCSSPGKHENPSKVKRIYVYAHVKKSRQGERKSKGQKEEDTIKKALTSQIRSSKTMKKCTLMEIKNVLPFQAEIDLHMAILCLH